VNGELWIYPNWFRCIIIMPQSFENSRSLVMPQKKQMMNNQDERPRSKGSSIIRYAVCLVAVSWLIINTDWGQLKQVWIQADKSLILISLLAFGPAPILISIRLRLLLKVHNVHLSIWQVIKLTFAGNFVIWTLPVGTPGGDSVKAYYVARETSLKHEAVTTVFFDRLIGVMSLVMISGIVVLCNWHNPAFARWGRIIGILIVFLLAGGSVYFSRRLRRIFRLDQLVSRLPLASHLQRIDQAVFEFRHSIKIVLLCFVLSWILQIVGIISVFLSGWALGVGGEQPIQDFLIYLAYTPISFLAGVLPIGVMEETFKQLFVDEAGLGTREAAYSMSLLNRVVQLAWALPGALVVLKGKSQWSNRAVKNDDGESK